MINDIIGIGLMFSPIVFLVIGFFVCLFAEKDEVTEE